MLPEFIAEGINMIMGIILIGCLIAAFLSMFSRGDDEDRYNGAGTTDQNG